MANRIAYWVYEGEIYKSNIADYSAKQVNGHALPNNKPLVLFGGTKVFPIPLEEKQEEFPRRKAAFWSYTLLDCGVFAFNQKCIAYKQDLRYLSHLDENLETAANTYLKYKNESHKLNFEHLSRIYESHEDGMAKEFQKILNYNDYFRILQVFPEYVNKYEFLKGYEGP